MNAIRKMLPALAIPVLFGAAATTFSNLPSIERWPWSPPPAKAIKSATALLARIETRLKFERDVAKRAEDNADRTREALAHVRKHRYPVAVMLEWDASVTRAEQVAMAKREIVSESEAEFDQVSACIKELTAQLAEQSRDQGAQR